MLDNKKFIEISIYVIIIIFLAILFEKILNNFSIIMFTISGVWSFITGILSPFIYAFFIAYLLNTPMRNFETHVVGRFVFFKKRPRLMRGVSLITTYLVLISCIVWIIAYLFPEIYSSFQRMALTIPDNIKHFERQYTEYWGESNPVDALAQMINNAFSQNYTAKDIIGFVV